MIRKIVLTSLAVFLLGAAALMALHVIEQNNKSRDGANALVALGDSVAAGDGLELPAHPTTEDAACHRSGKAYPELLAKSLHVRLKQFACSGAKATTGLLQTQTAGSSVIAAQLTSAQPYVSGNDVVLTIGANDVGWSDLLTRCANTDCTGTPPVDYEPSLQSLSRNLANIFQTINAAHPRLVIVNQYYNLINPTDTCYDVYGITTAKINWVNARESELNQVIKAAAEQNGAQVVPINFSGHLLCAADSWIQSALDMAPLHPNIAGQQQIAVQDAQAFLTPR